MYLILKVCMLYWKCSTWYRCLLICFSRYLNQEIAKESFQYLSQLPSFTTCQMLTMQK